uniref:Ras- protein Rab-15 n=1 Tax=Sphaerodactylus townsendi TaxID=933632 RepID=A0ACB8G2I1_9SAUR
MMAKSAFAILFELFYCGIFLVYDISSERSYQHIMKWASDVDEYAPDGVQKILIGNKADEEEKRQVGREQGLQLAKEYGMDFYETSACTSLNIKESFTRLTELVLQAHKKELDGLRAYAADELTLVELEEYAEHHLAIFMEGLWFAVICEVCPEVFQTPDALQLCPFK